MPNANATINGKFEIEPNVRCLSAYYTYLHSGFRRTNGKRGKEKGWRVDRFLKNREKRNRTPRNGTKLMRIP